MFPYQISFLDFPRSEFVEKAIETKLIKMESFFTPIVRCKVIVSCPHHHSHSHRQYYVEILVSIPGNDIVVVNAASKSKADQSVYDAISESFRKAERALKRKSEQLHKDKHRADGRLSFTPSESQIEEL